MKKFAIVMLLGLMSVTLAYGQAPTAPTYALYEIDAIVSETITAAGNGSSNPVATTPDSASIPWLDGVKGDDAWDFSDGVAESGVWDIPYDMRIQGTVDIDFNTTGTGNIWMTIGLGDKWCWDGNAVGHDNAITYGSGSQGFGRNAGLTIIGTQSTDDQQTGLKTEDGWGAPNQGSTEYIDTVNFDFEIRYGFTDSATRDGRTISAWTKPAGAAASEWYELDITETIGYPINGGSTSRPNRYLNDQWDQTLLAAYVTMDDAGATGGADISMTMQLDALGGDFDLDGKVDVVDLGILATNYNLTGQNWMTGDTNNDGAVDVTDLGVLATYYGQSVTAAAVPEPSTLVLLFSALGLLLIRRR